MKVEATINLLIHFPQTFILPMGLQILFDLNRCEIQKCSHNNQMGLGESREDSLRVLGGERELLNLEYIDRHADKIGIVSIRGVRMGMFLGLMLHNGIVVDLPGEPFYIAFQFGSRGLYCYKAGSLRGSHRRTLGSYPLKKIYSAAQAAFKPGYDYTENNCNHYVNRFLQLFGESPPFECIYS